MELVVSVKGTRYTAEDKKTHKVLYTVKKKGIGATKFILLDASNYQLYSLLQGTMDRKPVFNITHDNMGFMSIYCTSLFLDPSLKVEGREKFDIVSKDRHDFQIIHEGQSVGRIVTLITVANELQYEIEIADKYFDDYVVFFVVAIDRSFGDMNRPE